MLYHGGVLEGQGTTTLVGAVERVTLTQAASVVAVLAVDRYWVPKNEGT
jgi:tetrahydromethanopterin S-methyltransferase subunit D